MTYDFENCVQRIHFSRLNLSPELRETAAHEWSRKGEALLWYRNSRDARTETIIVNFDRGQIERIQHKLWVHIWSEWLTCIENLLALIDSISLARLTLWLHYSMLRACMWSPSALRKVEKDQLVRSLWEEWNIWVGSFKSLLQSIHRDSAKFPPS